MATTSAVLEDELLSKFADVFQQFKPLSAHYKKLLAVWYFRLFVKCATLSMLLILGVFHYRNGVFDYNEWAVLYAASVIICVFSSAMQLRRDRRLETYFNEISDAFGDMTEKLSNWCQANNPSFAKVFKLFLEETNKDRSIDLQTKDLMLVMIFDGVIWSANAVCLLTDIFSQNQLQFTILPFFIVTVLMVAVENILINMQSETYRINENMLEEINQICSIVKKYKEIPDGTGNCFGERKPETNDDSGFMATSIDFQKSHEKKDDLNKTLIVSSDSEQQNDVFSETSQKECLLEHRKIKVSVQKTFESVPQKGQCDTSDANKKETVSLRKINPNNDVIHQIGISSYNEKKCDVVNESQTDSYLENHQAQCFEIHNGKTSEFSEEPPDSERKQLIFFNEENNTENNNKGIFGTDLVKDGSNTCEENSTLETEIIAVKETKQLDKVPPQRDRLKEEGEDLNTLYNFSQQQDVNSDVDHHSILIKNKNASSPYENSKNNTCENSSLNTLKEKNYAEKTTDNSAEQDCNNILDKNERLKDGLEKNIYAEKTTDNSPEQESNNSLDKNERLKDEDLEQNIYAEKTTDNSREQDCNSSLDKNERLKNKDLEENIYAEKTTDNSPEQDCKNSLDQNECLKDEDMNAKNNASLQVEGNVDGDLYLTLIENEIATLPKENNNTCENESGIPLKENIDQEKILDIAPEKNDRLENEEEDLNAPSNDCQKGEGNGNENLNFTLIKNESAATPKENNNKNTYQSDSSNPLKGNIKPGKILLNAPVQNYCLKDKAEDPNASNNVCFHVKGNVDVNLHFTLIKNESAVSTEENNNNNASESDSSIALNENINLQKVLDNAAVQNVPLKDEAEDLNTSNNTRPHVEGNVDINLHFTLMKSESEASPEENNSNSMSESDYNIPLNENINSEKMSDIAPAQNESEDFNESNNVYHQQKGNDDEDFRSILNEKERAAIHKENNYNNTTENDSNILSKEIINLEKTLNNSSVQNDRLNNEAEDFNALNNVSQKAEGHVDENLHSTVIENESLTSYNENNSNNTCESKASIPLKETTNLEKIVDIAPMRNESAKSPIEYNNNNACESEAIIPLKENINPEKIVDIAFVRNETEDLNASGVCHKKEGNDDDDFHSAVKKKESPTSYNENNNNNTCESEASISLKETAPVKNETKDLNASDVCQQQEGHDYNDFHSVVKENERATLSTENNKNNTCESESSIPLNENINPEKTVDIAPVGNEAEYLNASRVCHEQEGHDDNDFHSVVKENESATLSTENNKNNTCESESSIPLKENINPEEIVDIASERNEAADLYASGVYQQQEGHDDNDFHSVVKENESATLSIENNKNNTCDSESSIPLNENTNPEKTVDIAPVANEGEYLNASGVCQQQEGHDDNDFHSVVKENESATLSIENNKNNICESESSIPLNENINPEKTVDNAPVGNEAEYLNASGVCQEQEGHDDNDFHSVVKENESATLSIENNKNNTCDSESSIPLNENTNPEKTVHIAPVANEGEYLNASGVCQEQEGHDDNDFHSVVKENESATLSIENNRNNTCERESSIPLGGHDDNDFHSVVKENESATLSIKSNKNNTCESESTIPLKENINPQEIVDIVSERNEAEDLNASGVCQQQEGHDDNDFNSFVKENESATLSIENNKNNTFESESSIPLNENTNPEKTVDIAPVANEAEYLNASGVCQEQEGHDDNDFHSFVKENESATLSIENNKNNTFESEPSIPLNENTNPEKTVDNASVANEAEYLNASGVCQQQEGHDDNDFHSVVKENESATLSIENNKNNTCESESSIPLNENINPEKTVDFAPVGNEAEYLNASGVCQQQEGHDDNDFHSVVKENESATLSIENNRNNTCESESSIPLKENINPEEIVDIASERNEAEYLNASGVCQQQEGHDDNDFHSVVKENESATLSIENNKNNTFESESSIPLNENTNPEKTVDIAPAENEAEYLNASGVCQEQEGHDDNDFHSVVMENESATLSIENNRNNTSESESSIPLNENINPEKTVDIAPVGNEAEYLNASGVCQQQEGHDDSDFHSVVKENESATLSIENNKNNTCESESSIPLNENTNPEKTVDIAPAAYEAEYLNASGVCQEQEGHDDNDFHSVVKENESATLSIENNKNNTFESESSIPLNENTNPEKTVDIAPAANEAEYLNASGVCQQQEGHNNNDFHSVVKENESATLSIENNKNNTCESESSIPLNENIDPEKTVDFAPVGNEAEYLNASGVCQQQEGHDDNDFHSVVKENESATLSIENNRNNTCESESSIPLKENINPEEIVDIASERNEAEYLNASGVCQQQEGHDDNDFHSVVKENESATLSIENNRNNTCESESSIPLKENINPEKIVDIAPVRNEAEDLNTSGDCQQQEGHDDNNFHSVVKENEGATSSIENNNNNTSESKAQIIMSHEKLSTENSSTGEVSVVIEKNVAKITDFADKKGMEEINSLKNASLENEANTESYNRSGALTFESAALNYSEKENFQHLSKNKSITTEAKSNLYETDAKRPYVSEKNGNDPNTGCTTEEKCTSSIFPYSDTADESGDDVHFVLKKRRPLDIIRRKYVDQWKTKVCDENQIQTTSKTLHTIEQFRKNKIALNYGKFGFCMDLCAESEIELEFKSSGKSRKRSTVYPYKKDK